MAGKDFAVRATPAAVAAIDGLRGRARKSYEAFEGELRKQGCKVAGTGCSPRTASTRSSAASGWSKTGE